MVVLQIRTKSLHKTCQTNGTDNSKLITIKPNSTYRIPGRPTQPKATISQLQHHEQSFPSLIQHKGNTVRTIFPFPRAQVCRIQIPETPNAFVHNRVPAILSARLLLGSPPSLPGARGSSIRKVHPGFLPSGEGEEQKRVRERKRERAARVSL